MVNLAIRHKGDRSSSLPQLGSWARDFDVFFNEMDKMFAPFRSVSEASDMTAFKADIHESDGSYLISLDMPGVLQEDIKLELSNNLLTVTTERKSDNMQDDIKTHRMERYYGVAKRTFALPDGIDSDSIAANYENGVLSVSIPKEEVAKPKKIQIGSGKSGFLKKIKEKTTHS